GCDLESGLVTHRGRTRLRDSSRRGRLLALLSSGYGVHRDLHSFPTRRSSDLRGGGPPRGPGSPVRSHGKVRVPLRRDPGASDCRSEEHTSELQSREKLVCRLLLEKKKKTTAARISIITGAGWEGLPPDEPSQH